MKPSVFAKKIKLKDKEIGVLLIIAAFIVLYHAVSLYYMGYHNTDFGYNYQIIAMEVNPYLEDYDLRFKGVDETYDNTSNSHLETLSTMYKVGLRQTERGFHLMFLSAVLFGIGLMAIMIPEKNKKG